MTCYARVTEAGEFVVPAELARTLGVRSGDLIALDQHAGAIVLKTYADIVREGQEAFKATIKRPFTVDDFLAERGVEHSRHRSLSCPAITA